MIPRPSDPWQIWHLQFYFISEDLRIDPTVWPFVPRIGEFVELEGILGKVVRITYRPHEPSVTVLLERLP